MVQDVDYKPFLSRSMPADQRQLVYRTLAQIRQHSPFARRSAFVVQAAHLPLAVQITQQEGPTYTWHCAGNQGSASSLLQAV
ncbi:MAG TPA: hypothetical protein VIY29_23595 [Ktedonobacteraceae bacterium]